MFQVVCFNITLLLFPFSFPLMEVVRDHFLPKTKTKKT